MGRLWLNISRVFLFAAFSFAIIAAQPAQAAIPLFGTSEEEDVSFEPKDASVDGNKVIIKGHFKNRTDNFQRVIGYTMNYIFFDDEGVSIISGAFKSENLSIEVGNEPVEYTVTVENKDALIYDVAHDASGWKVRASVKTEK